MISLAWMQRLQRVPNGSRSSRIVPSSSQISQQPSELVALVPERVDLPGPELGTAICGGRVPALRGESAASGSGAMDMDMLAQWWYRVRPHAEEARRSRASVARTVDQGAAVDAAVEGTPAYLPELVEAVTATAVFDFGAYFGAYFGTDSGNGDAEVWHRHRRRRSRGRRKRSTRGSVAPGDAGLAAAGGAVLPRWRPVRMGVLAARELLGEETVQECVGGVGGGAGGARGGGGTVMSVSQQVADAEKMRPPDARRLRQLQRVLRRQREQMVAVGTAGEMVGQLDAWLQLAQAEVSEEVSQCQRSRAWLQEVFRMLGLGD